MTASNLDLESNELYHSTVGASVMLWVYHAICYIEMDLLCTSSLSLLLSMSVQCVP